MAIQFIQQPGAVSFSGDPIIAKVKTTLSGKTFLRVQTKCAVTVYRDGESYDYAENFSYEVGSDGVAVFSVNDTIKTAFGIYVSQEVTSAGIQQTLFAAKYKLTFQEVYLDGMVEVTEGKLESSEYKAVMGALTEFERLTSPSADTSSILGNGRILSRKPAMERVVKGMRIAVPAVSTKTDTIAYYVKQGETKKEFSVHTGGILVPKTLSLADDWLKEGEVEIGVSGEIVRKYVAAPHRNLISFLFLNSFELLESVTAESRESLTYEIESETYVVGKEIGFRPNTSLLSYSDPASGKLKMSSGYVSPEWAEWWLSDFVVTRRAWMWKENRWIPVAIIPEESNKLYDRSKPGLVAVNFEVRYSFAGGTQNSFVK